MGGWCVGNLAFTKQPAQRYSLYHVCDIPENSFLYLIATSVILTGWAMSEHAQALMISTKVHTMFGYVLMLEGLARIIEICFVVPNSEKQDSAADSDRHSERTLNGSGMENPRLTIVQAFRHLPPFVSTLKMLTRFCK